MKEKVIFCWSGGKDSALAFYELQKANGHEVMALLTTVSEDYDRISIHGVRQSLLEEQAQSLGIHLEKVFLSKTSTNTEYESKMRETLTRYADNGVRCSVFGDIFLEDLKKHREENLAKIGARAIFPIWKEDTAELAQRFIDYGFKAIITCVDTNSLDGKYVGRNFDGQFLSELPADVDPCGENGEFHSFVYDGPIFKEKIRFSKGEIVLRENRFYYCDLIPAGDPNG